MQSNQQTLDQEVIILSSSDEETKSKVGSTKRRKKSTDSKGKSTTERNCVKAIKLQNATLKHCVTNATISSSNARTSHQVITSTGLKKELKFQNFALSKSPLQKYQGSQKNAFHPIAHVSPHFSGTNKYSRQNNTSCRIQVSQNNAVHPIAHVSPHFSGTNNHSHRNNTSCRIQQPSKNSLKQPKNFTSSYSSSKRKYPAVQFSHQIVPSLNLEGEQKKNEKILMTKLDNLKKGGLSIENVKNVKRTRNASSEECVILNKAVPKFQDANFKNYSTITSKPSKKILKATKKLGGLRKGGAKILTFMTKDESKHSEQKSNVSNTTTEREKKLVSTIKSTNIVNISDDNKLIKSSKLNAALLKSDSDKFIELNEKPSLRFCDIIEIEKTSPEEEFSLSSNASIILKEIAQQENETKINSKAVCDKQSNGKNVSEDPNSKKSILHLDTSPMVTKFDDSKNQHASSVKVENIQNGPICSKLTIHTSEVKQKAQILNTISFDENVKECFLDKSKPPSEKLKNANEFSEMKNVSDICLSTSFTKHKLKEKSQGKHESQNIYCDPASVLVNKDPNKKLSTEHEKLSSLPPIFSSELSFITINSHESKHSLKPMKGDFSKSEMANPAEKKLSNAQKRLCESEEDVPTLSVNKRTKKDKEEPIVTVNHSKKIDAKEKITLEKNITNEENFKNFLEFCKPLVGKVGVTLDDWTQISKNLFTGYHAANSSYTMSDEFMNLISDTRKTIENNSSAVLTELHTVAKELKAYKIRKPKKHKRHKPPESKCIKPNQITSYATEKKTNDFAENSSDFAEKLKINNVTEQLKSNDFTEKLKTNNVTEELKINHFSEELKTNNVTEELMTNNVAEELMTNNVAEELMTNNVAEVLKNNVAKELKTNNITEELKTNNITEELKTNNTEELKTNNAEELKTNNTEELKTNNIAEELKNNNVTEELKTNYLKTEVVEHKTCVNETLKSSSKADNLQPPISDYSALTSFDQAKLCNPNKSTDNLHASASGENSYFTSLYLVAKSSTGNSDAAKLTEPLSSSSHNLESKLDENVSPQHSSASIEPSSPTSVDEVLEDSNTSSLAPENVILMNSTEFKQNERRERYIRKLEKLLGKIDRKIKKLQQKELSLDDLDDDQSSYVMEDKLKTRFMKIWSILCKEKKRSVKVGRETDRPIVYKATRFEAVNKAVEKFVNKKKIFPDFSDICDIVNKVHVEIDLGLQSYEITELARGIFQDIGFELKQRRLKDFQQLMGCSLTDDPENANDPADQDENLQKVLQENATAASKKLDEVLTEFALKQMKLKDGEDKADSSDSNNEENDDNELNETELPETEAVISSSDEEREYLPMLGSTSVQPLHAVAASLRLNADQEHSHFENEVIDILSNSDASTEPNSEAQDDIKTFPLPENNYDKISVSTTSALT